MTEPKHPSYPAVALYALAGAIAAIVLIALTWPRSHRYQCYPVGNGGSLLLDTTTGQTWRLRAGHNDVPSEWRDVTDAKGR